MAMHIYVRAGHICITVASPEIHGAHSHIMELYKSQLGVNI